jgi:hypothetical protein
MMSWWKWPLRFAIVAAALAIALDALVLVTGGFLIPFKYEGPLQYALKFLNFWTLSKERLIDGAKGYIRVVAGDDQMACLYVVACDGEHAISNWCRTSPAGTFRRRRTGFGDAGGSAPIAPEEPRISGFTSFRELARLAARK